MTHFLKTLSAAAIAVVAFSTPALADRIAASSTFKSASDHITTGGVSIVKTDAGATVVILDKNFSLDGAPDPTLGFGKDGKFVKASLLGDLQNKEGLQIYVVPAGIDSTDFNEIYIWCDDFSVPLGVAALN